MRDDLRAALVGTWRLVAWQFVGPDRPPVDAFGPRPRGLLTYTAEGWMSVVITATARAWLPDDPAIRTETARAAAFDGVHAYAGRYSIQPGFVIHHVSVSTIPNYEGTDQQRRFTLTGDSLTLSTPPGQAAHLTPGSSVVGRLTWQRLPAASTAPS